MEQQDFLCALEKFLSDAKENHTLTEFVEQINNIRETIHEHSPFKNEPVDLVRWVCQDTVIANDYNPNKVAPPEMQLLELSIMNDGYTQPIVTMPKGTDCEVIDGFHRNRVGKESAVVAQRIQGFLPVVAIRKEQMSKSDRIASTIRHNRARGKHQVDAMSEIVIELKNRNWRNERVAKELGMDIDEVLRLCQISGLAEVFSDADFTKSWDVEDSQYDDFVPLDDSSGSVTKEEYKHLNTDDEERIFHTYDKWECQKAGFYNNSYPGKKRDDCEKMYADFLSSADKFSAALEKLIVEWKYSCEHYLSNKSMNRIAWLGQAAMCYATGIPSAFRGGWNLLTNEQQETANNVAFKYLNKWLENSGRTLITIDEAMNFYKQTEIY